MKRTILVIAAHPDDELLGVGGTIRKLTNQGAECHAVIVGEGVTSRSDKRSDVDSCALMELKKDAQAASKIVGYKTIEFCELPDNRLDSMDLLDIIKVIMPYIEKYRPETIFTHHHGDLNIDHRIVCEAVLTACRPIGHYFVERIYAFETPSSTEWNYIYEKPFTPNVYFDVTDTIDTKIEGMKCYRSESARYPHPRSAEALKALAEYRGSNVGVEMAEAFICMREVIK